MVDTPKVRGVKSLSGTKYLIVSQEDVTIPVPLHALATTSAGVTTYLRTRGILLLGTAMVERFVKSAASVVSFHDANLADHAGWNEKVFVLPDGEAIAPSKSDPVIVAIEGRPDSCAQAGTMKAWKRGVAKPLAGQPLGMFMLMLPFMPPLLALSSRADNFGFELVGKKGVGKSTLQQLAASVIGRPLQTDGPPYWLTWDTTLNAVENGMETTSAMLMILEEAALFFADEAKGKRAAAFKAFAFKAAAGSTKRRWGTSTQDAGQRFSYLSSSNVSLTELIGDKSEVASAAADRLITITIPPDRPYGAFDRLPDGHEDSSGFAASLMDCASRNHGVAIRRYLHGLVHNKADNERQLRDEIGRYVAQFRRQTAVNANDGSSIRVADAFGLVYAAGRLAKRYGALPASFDCGPAVLACYQLHKVGLARLPFTERLNLIAARPDTAMIGRKVRGLSKSALKAARAIVGHSKGGRWLIIRPEHMAALLPDWPFLDRTDEVRAVLKREGGRQQSRFQLSLTGGPERAFVFRLDAPSSTDDFEEPD